MPPPFAVVLTEYDCRWPKIAADHIARLQALAPVLLAVHHIGSTSVPGLVAKPIIDLMALVTDMAALDEMRSRLEALGYDWHGELGIPGRRYCTLADEAGARLSQLHFFEANSPHVERHLAFRDFLRANPDIAHEYEDEKRRARQLHPHDSHAYGDEKAAWIQATEARALLWCAQLRSR